MKNSIKDSINIRNIVAKYTKQWKWFLLCVVVAFVLAFFKIRYTNPEYGATAVIQIIEDNTAATELSAFKDLQVLGAGNKNKVEDEIESLVSRSNFVQVVKKLKLNLKIETIGKVINTEIYDGPCPFVIDFKTPDSILDYQEGSFFVEILSSNSYGFSRSEEESLATVSFDKVIDTDLGNVKLHVKEEIVEEYIGVKYKVSLTPTEATAAFYKNKVVIGKNGDMSNIVNLSVNSPNKKKSRDILNTLIMVYNNNAIINQKYLADRTEKFINNRISRIYSNLTAIDSTAEDFMESRGITDIASQSNLNMNLSAGSESELQDARVQQDIASSLTRAITNQRGYGLINSNLNNSALNTVVSSYNNLSLQRRQLLESTNELHPDVVQLTRRMNSLKTNIISTLNDISASYDLKVTNLSKQLAKSQSRLYSTPGNARALNEISRDQQNMASLYQYLIRKREEAQITAASTSPKCEILDAAYNPTLDPVSPNKPITYLAAIILGFLIPFSIIYVKELMDNKIRNKMELEKIVADIPILAEIPRINKESKIVQKIDRSVLAESLRILRTNLDYLIKSDNRMGESNVIFVTSSVSGEGKTFIASNLSLILANTDKKVLLIGADIRNPKLHTFFGDGNNQEESKTNLNDYLGLTEYLSDKKINLNDLIIPTEVGETKIDIIYSGRIPPNPSELLMSNRLKILLDEVSQLYDYIIVDTAPLVVVTDTLLISDCADQTIYVTRAGFTENEIIGHPIGLLAQGKVKNLSFVLNDVKQSDLGYGGKYGYGYGAPQKKWWKLF